MTRRRRPPGILAEDLAAGPVSNPRITADVYAGLVGTGRAALGVDLAAAIGQ